MLNAESVATLSELDAPLLTAYLNRQPSEPSRHQLHPETLAWMKRHGKALVEKVSPGMRSAVREQLARIDNFLAERKPGGKALLILAGPAVWKAIPLQDSVENELAWGKPALMQLQVAIGRRKLDCVVVLNRKRARFLDYSDEGMNELFDLSFAIDSSQWKKKGSYVTVERTETTRGSQHDAYEHRVDARYKHFLRQVAKRCAALCKVRTKNLLILVGEPRFVKEVEKALPVALAGRVQSVLRDVGSLSLPKLHGMLKQEIGRFRQKSDEELVGTILRHRQRATVGIDETIAQLQKGRIRALLLSDRLNGVIHECPKCGQFDRAADPICSVCHRERRSVDLRQAILQLARSHDTDIHVISEPSHQLDEVGGLAGSLRDRTQSELR